MCTQKYTCECLLQLYPLSPRAGNVPVSSSRGINDGLLLTEGKELLSCNGMTQSQVRCVKRKMSHSKGYIPCTNTYMTLWKRKTMGRADQQGLRVVSDHKEAAWVMWVMEILYLDCCGGCMTLCIFVKTQGTVHPRVNFIVYKLKEIQTPNNC